MITETLLAIGDPDIPSQFIIPSHLLDPLSGQIMLNPVTTELGDTYEKERLQE